MPHDQGFKFLTYGCILTVWGMGWWGGGGGGWANSAKLALLTKEKILQVFIRQKSEQTMVAESENKNIKGKKKPKM